MQLVMLLKNCKVSLSWKTQKKQLYRYITFLKRNVYL